MQEQMNSIISKMKVEFMSIGRNESGSGEMGMMLGLVGFVAIIMFALMAGAMPDFSSNNVLLAPFVQ